MKYDLKKELEDKTMVEVQWHGEPTRVLVNGDAEKTEVKTGDVLKLTRKQAAELLGYSSLWTFEGDVPTPQPYRENLKRLAQKKTAGATGEEETVLTPAAVAKMNKKQLHTELKKLGATFNDQATNDELKALLTEALEEKEAAPEMVDHEVTEEDMEAQPEWLTEDHKVGDVVQLPKVGEPEETV